MSSLRIKNTFILTLLSILMFFAIDIFAAAPTDINYQGRLRQNGQPSSGIKSIEFKIYDGATAGTMIWTSDARNIKVSTGMFSYQVGSQDGAGYKFSKIDWAAGPYWLEIVVAGSAFVPREKILGSPYSFFSTTSTYTLNLTGGSIGSIPYQAGANTTALLSPGTPGYILSTNGAAAPTWISPASGPSGLSGLSGVSGLTGTVGGAGISGISGLTGISG